MEAHIVASTNSCNTLVGAHGGVIGTPPSSTPGQFSALFVAKDVGLSGPLPLHMPAICNHRHLEVMQMSPGLLDLKPNGACANSGL
jgi:hypothetical protein